MSRFVPVPRRSDIVVQEFENEVLIYDLRKQKALCLNETASKVWQMCDGKRNVTEIANLLSKESGLAYSEDVILLTLGQLKRDRLLEFAKTHSIDFPDINRRQLIHKIGLASVITLPFISSLVAPSAAHAQSCVVMVPGTGCTGAGMFCAVATNMCCTCSCLPSAVPPIGSFRCA